MMNLIIQSSTESVLHAVAIEEGMIPLRHNGWAKVIAGETTIEEVVRVTAADLEMAA